MSKATSTISEELPKYWLVRPEHRPWLRVAAAFSKIVVGVLGLVTVLVAIPALSTSARDVIFPNERGYDQLARLAAGLSVESFTEVLGPPSTFVPADVLDEYNYFESVTGAFGGSTFIVRVLAKGTGETVQYSVTSCNAEFKPRLVAPNGDTVTLQTPISQAVSGESEPGSIYVAATTGLKTKSSTVVYGESIGDASNAQGARAFGYGANEMCGRIETPDGTLLPEYSGNASDAPRSIRDFRESTPATFYVETWEGRPLTGEELDSAVPQQSSVPHQYQ